MIQLGHVLAIDLDPRQVLVFRVGLDTDLRVFLILPRDDQFILSDLEIDNRCALLVLRSGQNKFICSGDASQDIAAACQQDVIPCPAVQEIGTLLIQAFGVICTREDVIPVAVKQTI